MVPTYILAPNFTYHPNTSICLGDIIEYPDDPTKPLTSVPKSMLEQTTRHFDYDNEFSNQKITSLRGSIWANFLNNVSVKIGGGTSDEPLDKYTIRRLETIYFTKQPTNEDVAELVKDKKVKAAINAGLLRKRPVFMITGLKIARGFQLSRRDSSTTNVDAKFEVPVTSEVGIGADVDYSRANKAEEKYRTGQDIVFAYQLHIIAHKRKGWKLARKDADITVFKAPAAFLNKDEEGGEEELVEAEEATESILRDFDEEMEVEAISAEDGGEECMCLVFGDA